MIEVPIEESPPTEPPKAVAEPVAEPVAAPVVSSAHVPPACAFGTPAQPAAQQQAVPKLEHVLQEAIEDPRNKTQLLRYEQDVQKFLRDASAQMFSFPAMGGYHRLMVHRLAEYYCMEHEVDEGGVSPQAICRRL